MRYVLILVLIFLLAGCAPAGTADMVTAVPDDYDFSGVHLRLHNLSGQDLTAVTLTIGSQTEQIGSLSQAATSDFYTFTAVQQPPTIQASSGEAQYDWAADQMTADGLITGGEFTLELTIENDRLIALPLLENPTLQDAQYYADEMGVTLEEALSRLDTQNEDAISALQNQLQTNEADTFAGLWIQHEPEYRVMVAFTQNGMETIQKYVADDSELAQSIALQPAQYTYAQLEADQQALLPILDTMNLSAGVGIMVQQNRVELGTTDRAALDAALAEANIDLPESVVITTFYESVGEDPSFAITAVPDVFMPQLKQRDVTFMEALLIGELVVQDGCLRVKNENESTLVIWQADYFLSENEGILEILDEMGAVVARVGEMVYLGGGEQRAVNETEMQQPVPEQCGGPYWRMGTFLPAEYIPNVTADLPPLTQLYDGWEMGFAFEYPSHWGVNEVRFDSEGSTAVLTSRPMSTDDFEPFQPGDEMAVLTFMPFEERVEATTQGMLAAMERFADELPPNQELMQPPQALSLNGRPAAAMVYLRQKEDTTAAIYFIMTADADHFIWAMGFTPVDENWAIRPKIQAMLITLQPILVEGWQAHTVADLNLSLAYPAGWYVHDASKALQITPNSQPVWSSYADSNQPNDGPYFDLLHNLNRQMAATPLEEIENIVNAYEAEIEAIEPAAPLAARPDVAVGVYRFAEFEDGMVLLLGAAVNPIPDSPQSTIAMTTVVSQDELAEMQPIFEAVLRSLRPADALPIIR